MNLEWVFAVDSVNIVNKDNMSNRSDVVLHVDTGWKRIQNYVFNYE